MSEHPIQGLMATAMESIKEMVDVNTIVGDTVETPDGTIIIPISRVTFGFAAGGSELSIPKNGGEPTFGGGSGAGVSINPVAFMVVGNGNIRLIPVTSNAPLERLLDFVPEVIDKIYKVINNQSHKKSSEE